MPGIVCRRSCWCSSDGMLCSSRRVYGCEGRSKTSRDAALLDDPPGVHHRDPVDDLSHDSEVVRDQHDRHAQFLLQVAQQQQDLRLDGDVERGRGLVGDQDLRAAGERDGNHDPLAHSAGQLVRILVESLLRIADADPFKQLQRTRARLGAAQAVMHAQGLADLFTDPEHRIERGHRLLEDHGDLLAADPVHRRAHWRGSRSLPSSRIRPPAMRPGGFGISLSTDRAVRLLPQPDSPTTPSTSPRASERLTPSTATCSRPRRTERTRRSSTRQQRSRGRGSCRPRRDGSARRGHDGSGAGGAASRGGQGWRSSQPAPAVADRGRRAGRRRAG